MKPSAPPVPVPTAAGRLTAKFGVAGDAGAAAGAGVRAARDRTVFGKVRPVGLPVAGASWR